MQINKEILRLAIPNIISNISVPFLSTVDTALMGRLSELHIGAVGVGAMIFNFIYWNFGFLRMGTTGITAQAYGKKEKGDMMQTLSRALLVATSIVIFLLLFQKPIGEGSFYLMNISEAQYGYVETYFFIRIWAAPASIFLFAFMGWYFGMQNAIIPLVLTIFINVINIILSYILVHHYNMGVAGVAWGTVIAQYAGVVLAMFLFVIKYKNLLSHFSRKATLEWKALTKYLTINRDIFIRTVCLTFAFGFFFSQSSKSGELVLAVNVVLLQFVNWMSYGVDGFAYASESLVGKYKGAGKKEALLKVVNYSFIWGGVLALFYALLYFSFGDALLKIFTDKPHILELADTFMWWMILFPLVSSACYIWDGIYIGLTASRAMMLTMLVAVVVFLISFYVLSTRFGNNGLWGAMIIFMASRGLTQWIYFRKYLKPNI